MNHTAVLRQLFALFASGPESIVERLVHQAFSDEFGPPDQRERIMASLGPDKTGKDYGLWVAWSIGKSYRETGHISEEDKARLDALAERPGTFERWLLTHPEGPAYRPRPW